MSRSGPWSQRITVWVIAALASIPAYWLQESVTSVSKREQKLGRPSSNQWPDVYVMQAPFTTIMAAEMPRGFCGKLSWFF